MKDIAIIGMSSLYAGSADLKEFWQNILGKKNCISPVPGSRWNIDDYFDPDPSVPDKTYCKMGGFIPEVDFDPVEFGLPPNTLEVTDTAQLLGLLLAKRAIKDAGYANATTSLKEKTGIILGAAGTSMRLYDPLVSRLHYPELKRIMINSGLSENDTEQILSKYKTAFVDWNEDALPGFLTNVISGRISNRLDFRGINLTVDAACAGSLAAVKLSVNELENGTCDMMITGGIDIDCSASSFVGFCKTPTLSKTGVSKPFDENADGIILGEGVGMVILKRLDDAVRDGDRIYSVIKGIGTSSDGKSKSIYAPNIDGQKKAFLAAYEETNISPNDIELFEAHGTGTKAGDKNELELLVDILKDGDSNKKTAALGSVKSQIGHTKAAAGAAGLIKSSLALYHKILPPAINIEKPSPVIEQSSLYLNTNTRPWIKKDKPRRAGISAYGFGGTNFHIVLEEYQHEDFRRIHAVPQTLIYHDSTPASLLANLKESIEKLQTEDALLYYHSVADKQDMSIPRGNARIGFIANSIEEAKELLETSILQLENNIDQNQFTHPKGIYYFANSIYTPDKKIVALFTGQGSSYLDMGKSLCLNFPEIANNFAETDKLFEKEQLSRLSDAVYPIPAYTDEDKKKAEKDLLHTEYSQAGIGTLSLGLYEIFAKAGFSPDIVAGHSFGELMALHASGVVDKQTYLQLIKARGRATRYLEEEEGGALLAVRGNTDEIKKIIPGLKGISMANENSRNQLALAGSLQAIESAKTVLEAEKFTCMVIKMPAFHSAYVDRGQAEFSKTIYSSSFNLPRTEIYSNITADKYPGDIASIKELVARNMRESVLFKDEIKNIADNGGYFFVEFGPRSILTNLVKDILHDKEHLSISLINSGKKDSDRQVRDAALHLRLAGIPMQHPDPYIARLDPDDFPRKKISTLQINAATYKSLKNKEKVAAALTEKEELKVVTETVALKQEVSELKIAVSQKQNIPAGNESSYTSRDIALTSERKKENRLSAADDSFSRQTNFNDKFLELHNNFLNQCGAISTDTIELIKKQGEIVSKLNDNNASEIRSIVEKISTNISELNATGKGTINSHEQFIKILSAQLGKQAETFGNSASTTYNEHPAAIESEPTEKSAESVLGIDNEKLIEIEFNGEYLTDISAEEPEEIQEQTRIPEPESEDQSSAVFKIISEKTGYPEEMLDMSMSIEADLGIDSLKKIEIISSLEEKLLGGNKIEAAALSEIQTPGDIQQIIGRQTGLTGEKHTEKDTGNKPSEKDIEKQVLGIISEKTGYPIEMLEPNMSMEADLGIDSLKKVEIISSLEEKLPVSINGNAAKLANLQTPGEIVCELNTYMSPATAEEPAKQAPAPEAESDGLLYEDVLNTFFKVISTTTGYPEEMLEESMELESDLGIDSLKKVEIISAITDIYPGQTNGSKAELTKLNSIKEIASFMANSQDSEQATVETPTENPVQYENTTAAIHQYKIELKHLPSPDSLELKHPNEAFIIHSDNKEWTEALSDRLSSQGWKTVIVSPADLNGISPVQNTIERISLKYGKIGGFISIQPEFTKNEEEYSYLKQVFFFAKYSGKQLNSPAGEGRHYFMTVTKLDGRLGYSGEFDGSGLTGGLTGLTKTLNQEWNNVFCRGLDIKPTVEIKAAIDFIDAEMHDPDQGKFECGFDGEGRYTLESVPDAEADSDADINNITDKDVILVSGGARGITAECIIKLAQQSNASFILLGRTPLDDEIPLWFDSSQDETESKRQIIEEFKQQGIKPSPQDVAKRYYRIKTISEVKNTLRRIIQTGSTVHYIACDIRKPDSVKNELAGIVEQTGPISCIVHGAGVLADKMIESKTEEDFDKVFSTKIEGLFSLLELVKKDDLKKIVMFSSIAALLGNRGQADYALANEALNKFAYSCKNTLPGCNAVSINWGPWEGGMVTPELRKMFEEKNISIIPLNQGTDFFCKAVLAQPSATQLAVMNRVSSNLALIPDKNEQRDSFVIRRKIKVQENPFLRDHVLNGKPVLPVTCTIAWISESARQLFPGFSDFTLADMQLYKGVIFDEDAAEDFFLEIQTEERTEKKIILSMKLSSQNKAGKIFYNYKATVSLSKNVELVKNDEVFRIPQQSIMSQEQDNFYNRIMFHGSSFQGVQRVFELDEKKIVFECHLPRVSEETQGRFLVQHVNPFLVDALHQGSLIWSKKYCKKACLPAYVKKSKQYKPLQFDTTYYSTIAVKSVSETYVIYDCIVHDEDGNLVLHDSDVKSALVDFENIASESNSEVSPAKQNRK